LKTNNVISFTLLNFKYREELVTDVPFTGSGFRLSEILTEMSAVKFDSRRANMKEIDFLAEELKLEESVWRVCLLYDSLSR
jgi:hypothetical protein